MCDRQGKIISSATCFFCKDSDDLLYFVTNNHVIEKSDYCYLYLTFIDETKSETSNELIFCELKNHITKHNLYDLCIVDFTHIYNKLISEGRKLIFSYIPIKSIISDFNNFNHIEEIYMVGYPNALISCDINYPIVRKGITATGLCDTLNNEDVFIIDIPVYGGSSGSPIYYIAEDDKVKLVGIISEKYYEKNYVYEIKDNSTEENKNNFVKVPNGLGYAIKSNAILDLINKLHGNW